MYRNILVAVDGSPTSTLALLETAKLAQADTTVRVVHVVENPVWSIPLAAGVMYDVELMRASFVQAGKDILERAKALLADKDIEARTHLVDLSEAGDRSIAAALVHEARDWPADLVVIGSHGRRGFRRLLMGSVAESVIRLAAAPVLLVRAITMATADAETDLDQTREQTTGLQ